ncbi:MAG: GNAT family N-acetyltransferase [Candidatus Thorarchaeota archaeon]
MHIRIFNSHDMKSIIDLANKYASFDSDVSEADFQPAWTFQKGLLVAEAENQIVGFVFAYLREVPATVLSRWDASKVAQIELLAVDPQYRGRGIGESLMNQLLESLIEEKIDLVLLHCPSIASEAKSLYDKLGFETRAYAMKKRL